MLLISINSFYEATLELKRTYFSSETFLHTIIFSILKQESFGNLICCKVVQLTKELRKKLDG
jgi:hypothetical protein